ncbi:FtsX-like permease family protein [Streptomyces qinglanensis]|uniref:FtsX-like permease family protein n=1 Tax=Streptomyces qinglanensis TaxID=943816 RepID=UPI0037BBD24C
MPAAPRLPRAVARPLRSLWAHASRFALPALAVVLGVACVTGALLYGGSARTAVEHARRVAPPDASVTITQEQPPAGPAEPGAGGLGPGLLERLRALPGAAGVRAVAEGSTFLAGRDGTLVGSRTDSAGVNYVPDSSGSDPRYPLAAGRGPRSAGEVALDRRAADRAGYRVGDRVRVVVQGEARDVRLVGVFTARDARVASGGTLTAFDEATARRRFGLTAISLTAADGTGEARLAARARKLLPPQAEAVTRSEAQARSAAGASAEGDKTTGLLLSFAAVVLLVAGFLVANTFAMLTAARAREHALLRVVGATRGNVLRLVLGEALLVGTAASAVGYPLGAALAMALKACFPVDGGAVAAPLPLVSLPAGLAALAVGVGVTALAAYVPARRAAAVAPMAALRTGEPPTPAALRRRNTVGCCVTGFGALLLWYLSDTPDLDMVTVAGAVLMTGLMLLTPWLAVGLGALLRGPLRRLAGVRGTLAVENARRNPRRTAATASALMVGLALVTAAGIGAASLSGMAERDAARAMASDLHVVPVDFAEIGDGTARRVARVPGAEAVTPTVPTGVELGAGRELGALAVDPRTVGRAAGLTVAAGHLDRLGRDGIALSRAEADSRGLRVGSPLGDRRVVAVYDGPERLGPALVPLSAARPGERPDEILVRAAPGRTDALRDRIRDTLDNPALLVQNRADAAREAARPYGTLLTLATALLSVAVLIGALGVVGTMAMSVRERTREIGVLRALGMNRRGVAWVIRLEALLICALGAFLGLAAGTATALTAVATQPAAEPRIPWLQLLLALALTAALTALATLPSTRRAANLPVVSAAGAEGA